MSVPLVRRHGGRRAAATTLAALRLGREPSALVGLGFFKRGFVPAGFTATLHRSGAQER